uniref:Uncharacterized protein LOC104217463 n=1 Tax=Nicotiana sylvestris TaxID=4096 RepID=A0A1U7VM53_NICSY|nr:PREDICTED: uncharacterized protein LOC104217463 [Nicotiana sylvestris]
MMIEYIKARGGGGLIRNHNGDWIIGYAIYNYTHTHTAIHMEILAFYNGLRLALNHTYCGNSQAPIREANAAADKLACYGKGSDPKIERNVMVFVYPPPLSLMN